MGSVSARWKERGGCMKICQFSMPFQKGRTSLLPSLLRNEGEDDCAHPLYLSRFRGCLRGTPISCFSWCNFEARRVTGSESVTWFSPVETVSKCRWDEKWSFVGLGSKSMEGLFQVLYLSYESSMWVTHCCPPECVWVKRAVLALLYFDFTSLVGVHTEVHLSLCSEIWLWGLLWVEYDKCRNPGQLTSVMVFRYFLYSSH